MKVQHIIGADLSKRSIDLVYHLSKTHVKINNSIDGFNDLIRWLQKLHIDISEAMIVMEHTGLYSYCFENFLHQHRIVFCKISALEIKKSIGLVRGKTDRLDAARIAEYGYEKKDRLIVDKPLSNDLKRLQVLHSTYQRLVRHRAALINALKEYKYIGIAEKDLIIQAQRQLIKNFDKQIKKLKSEIEMVINKQPALK